MKEATKALLKDSIRAKQIEAFGQEGDVAIAITTSDVEERQSGHSANIAQELIAARRKGLISMGLISKKSKDILKLLDLAISIPLIDTLRIQEGHITLLHIICELVEKSLFGLKI